MSLTYSIFLYIGDDQNTHKTFGVFNFFCTFAQPSHRLLEYKKQLNIVFFYTY
jgi:hypothetical protein